MSDKKGEGYRNEIERKSQNNLSIPKLEEKSIFLHSHLELISLGNTELEFNKMHHDQSF